MSDEKDMESTDVRHATHVRVGGRIEEISSTWGIDRHGRLAKPSEGGFGVVTTSGRRVGMMEANSYWRKKE